MPVNFNCKKINGGFTVEKKDAIKELENYKYDYEYYLEKFNNAEKLNQIVQEISTRVENLNIVDSAFNNELKDKLNIIKKEQINEEKYFLEMITKKRVIEERIDKIDQPYKSILLYKYISLLTFDEIASKMNYSVKRIYQLHQKGIEIYLEKYEKSSVAQISKS